MMLKRIIPVDSIEYEQHTNIESNNRIIRKEFSLMSFLYVFIYNDLSFCTSINDTLESNIKKRKIKWINKKYVHDLEYITEKKGGDS